MLRIFECLITNDLAVAAQISSVFHIYLIRNGFITATLISKYYELDEERTFGMTVAAISAHAKVVEAIVSCCVSDSL